MATNVGNVNVKVGTDTSAFSKGLSSSIKTTRAWSRDIKKQIAAVQTPMERYRKELGRLGQMKNMGMSTEMYSRSVAKLKGEFENLIPGLKRTPTMIQRITGSLKKGGGAWGKYGKLAAGAGVAMLAVMAAKKIIGGIKEQINAIDQLGHSAKKLGMTTEELGGLQFAGKLTGVDSRTMEMGLQRMTRRLSEAAHGTGEARNAIRELGLDAKKLSAMGPAKAFREIAKAMQKVEGQSERVRLSFKLFDSEGVRLVQTLGAGAAGLDAMAEEAKHLGILIDDVGVAKVQAAKDAWTRAEAAWGGVWTRATNELAPYIAMLGEGLVNAFKDVGRAAEGAGKKQGGFLAGTADFLFAGNQALQTAGILFDSSVAVADRGKRFDEIWAAATPSERAFTAELQAIAKANQQRQRETPEFFGNQAAADLLSKLQTDIATHGLSDIEAQLKGLRGIADPAMIADIDKAMETLNTLDQALNKVKATVAGPTARESFITKLQNDINTFDMTSLEKQLSKLNGDGSSLAGDLVGELQMKTFASRLGKQFETAAEKSAKMRKELEAWKASGVDFNQSLYDRAMAGLSIKNAAATAARSVQLPQAMVVGSREAYSAVARSGQANAQKQLLNVNKKQLTAMEIWTTHWDRIAEELEDKDAPVEIMGAG